MSLRGMSINAPRTKKSAATAVAGLFVFGAGLAVLRLNPFWRHEPARGGALDHHVYAWAAVGHLICAVGLLSAFGALILSGIHAVHHEVVVCRHSRIRRCRVNHIFGN